MKLPDFPCENVPEDDASARLLGLYPQRQDGLWMQRLKILGGRLTAKQWRALADIARKFTPDTPLHLSTRQDIELHDVPTEKVPAVQRALASAGLSTIGACGDTLRNVTVCPCSGVRDGSADLLPLAQAIRRRLEAMDGVYDLPRKFKIDLSCGPDCGRAYINDLGLVAAEHEGGWSLAAVVAGSLGAQPGTGITFRALMVPSEAVLLAEAAVELFAREGDRANRRRARLRHVRERMGDGPFLEALTQQFEHVRRQCPPEDVFINRCETGLNGQVRLHFANGDVSPAAADELARLAESEQSAVNIAAHHSVMVFGPSQDELEELLGAYTALPPAGTDATVVACPGSTWCRRALLNTRTVADKVRVAIAGIQADGTTVCISGCPNGCAHTAVADIGLGGRRAKINGSSIEAFDLYAGGGMGRTPRLAPRVARAIAVEDVPRAIAKLLDDRREA